MVEITKRKMIWSWALYDWANSAFATTVMAGFFPLFFKKYWSAGFSVTESTYALGLANSGASLALAFIAPLIGAAADRAAYRKKLLLLSTLIGAGASAGLGLAGEGQWILAIVLFSFGIIGFNGGLPFYDALLMQVADEKTVDRVSALGYGMGYLGGGLLFTLNVIMYLKFGVQGIQWSFMSVGVWWLLFSLPLFLNVPEHPARERQTIWVSLKESAVHTADHWRELKKHRSLLFFLFAFLLYNDAVNTIIKMAVDYGMSIGLADTDLIKALLMVQFIGFPSAIVFGRLEPVKGIWICLLAYLGISVYAYFLTTATEFFVVAAVIGLVQGGIQALSRSYYARLVRPEDSAKYFGFFNMIGRFSSIFGPFLVGAIGVATGNPRAGILVLTLFFAGGGLLLLRSRQVAQEAG
jgi:UMF1 family MFS transporter